MKRIVSTVVLLIGVVIMVSHFYPHEFAFPHTPTEDIFPEAPLRELAQAAARGDVAKIDEVLNTTHIDIDSEGGQKMTPLFWAVAAQNMTGIEALLKRGANPNKLTYLHINALGWAAGSKFPEMTDILRLLIQYGGDPNAAADDGGGTPLIIAIESLRWDKVHFLVEEAHVDVNSAGGYGTEPVVQAAIDARANYEEIFYLLEHGAKYYKAGPLGLTLVDIMTKDWHNRHEQPAFKKVAKYLQQQGVKFPVPSPPGSPLKQEKDYPQKLIQYENDLAHYNATIKEYLGHELEH